MAEKISLPSKKPLPLQLGFLPLTKIRPIPISSMNWAVSWIILTKNSFCAPRLIVCSESGGQKNATEIGLARESYVCHF